jgi:hypothetical protein
MLKNSYCPNNKAQKRNCCQLYQAKTTQIHVTKEQRVRTKKSSEDQATRNRNKKVYRSAEEQRADQAKKYFELVAVKNRYRNSTRSRGNAE